MIENINDSFSFFEDLDTLNSLDWNAYFYVQFECLLVVKMM